MSLVRAADLKVGDMIVSQHFGGDRARRVVSVRVGPGRLPIEVVFDGKGTWHFERETRLQRKDPK